MNVTYFTRKPFPGQVSIERVFKSVSDAMPSSITRKFFQVPNPSTGLRNAARNITESKKNQSEVNHITGDIHYLAACLDPKRTVLTIHDFVNLRRLSGPKRSLFRYLWYVLPVARAAVITVPSEWTKSELRRWLPRSCKPVDVVRNPLPSGFQPCPKPFAKDKPHFLFLGTKPNKNLERTAAALKGISCLLTVVGALTDEQAATLSQNAINFENRSNLTDEEVLQCYRECDAVLFASTYEGFGMPIIEANGVGRPVLTSRLSPMSEVANGAACLVDPLDSGSIRQGILRLIEDDDYRQSLIEKGYANAAQYSADSIASEYVSIYRHLLERAT